MQIYFSQVDTSIINKMALLIGILELVVYIFQY